MVSPNSNNQVSAFAVYNKSKSKNRKISKVITNGGFNLSRNGKSKKRPSNKKKSHGKKTRSTSNKTPWQPPAVVNNAATNKASKHKLKKSNIDNFKNVTPYSLNILNSSTNTSPKVTPKKSKKKKRELEDEDEPPQLIPIQPEKSAKRVRIEKEDEQSFSDSAVSQTITNLHKTDPTSESLKLFKWLIAPVNPKTFLSKYWESEVMYIERKSSNYYTHLLTTEKLDNIFREFPLYYNRNVDVVSYENGVKEVVNVEGRVIPSALYDYYSNGCSVRILNPHTYDQKVHLLISTLQEYFGTMVGTNVYLTPPGSQGFAPHYDDIEAFIIQLEGRKHWKLYTPDQNELLARYSSGNFKPSDIGEPFMEVTLNAGDLLYFPRGTIHEGRTDADAHSLHITVSVYQNTAYVDLLEHVLPDALKKAAGSDIEFRKGLPINYLKHLGEVNKNSVSNVREQIKDKVKSLVENLLNYVDVDQAADKLGRKFMYDSMPPVLSKEEVNYTSKYDGDYMKNGKIYNRIEIDLETEVRVIRYHCLRLTVEDVPKIYYNTDNSKVYHGEEEQFLIVDQHMVPAIQSLHNSYPKFIKVKDLPMGDNVDKMQLVSDLWERGLLVTNGPLPPAVFEDEETDDSEVDEVSD